MNTVSINVLDHGFIKVVDVMGNDKSIVQAARVSYGQSNKTDEEDKALINYLMKHKHTSPFEMCEIKLHLKMPIFIARQWIRHRTASINEISGRYTEMKDEFYIPKKLKTQSKTNKQCSDKDIDEELSAYCTSSMNSQCLQSFGLYGFMIDKNISKELSRIILPLNTYTEFYWKIDLHNLLHFLRLRLHEHAQFEIREYANCIAKIVQAWCPVAYEAFEEHVLYAKTFSRKQLKLLKQLTDGTIMKYLDRDGMSDREFKEIQNFILDK